MSTYQELKENLDKAQAEMKTFQLEQTAEQLEAQNVMKAQVAAQKDRVTEKRRERLRQKLAEAPDKLKSSQVAELIDLPAMTMPYMISQRVFVYDNNGFISKSSVKAWIKQAADDNGYQPGDRQPGHGYESKQMLEARIQDERSREESLRV